MSKSTASPRRSWSRRQFLQTSAVAGASTLGFPAIVSAISPNAQMNLAVIGAGGRGGSNLRSFQSENIVALCDVNSQNLAKAAADYPNARTYKDYRKLYEKTNDIDAVVVSVPEHTHAFATLPALKAGKHVYCEKPLTRDVYEARVITEAAAEAKVVTQMGTQIHGTDNYRRVVELVRSGVIGPIREVHVWVSRAWGWQTPADAERNKDRASTQEKPTDAQTPPDYLDWDLWLGPAPYRPFNEVYFPGPKWYRWWDFGNGTMSDLGSHWNDLPFWALELDAPKTIEAFGPPAHPELAPASMGAKYTYGPRGSRPGLTLTWYQGDEKPDLWKKNEIPQWGNGHLFVGEEGMILSDYGKHLLLPQDKFADFKPLNPWIAPTPGGHHQEWLEACKNGGTTGSDFAYAGPLTEANHLGNVAFRAGTKIEWDAKNMRIPNAPKAEQFLKREYRKGWSLE